MGNATKILKVLMFTGCAGASVERLNKNTQTHAHTTATLTHFRMNGYQTSDHE